MRYRALDGWRGICAVLVAVHHFHVNSHLYDVPLIGNGYLFVDFFFVLSGFVICHAWGARIRRPPDFRLFMARRFARVWPLHAVVLALFVMVEAAKAAALSASALTAENAPFSGDTMPQAIATNLLLVHALGLHDRATWNYPSWSISTEFYTYAFFGLLCLAGLARRLAPVAVMAAAGAAVVAAFSREWLHTIADFGFFRCIYGFFIGCAVHHLVTRRKWRPGGSLAEAAVVAVVAAVVSASPKAAPLSMAAPLVFGLAVAVFAAERGVLSRLLLTTPVQALGTWSYSIYLVHSLLLVVVGRTVTVLERGAGLALTETVVVNGQARPLLDLGGVWGGDLAVLAFIAALVAVSALAWRWVERPGQALVNRLVVG